MTEDEEFRKILKEVEQKTEMLAAFLIGLEFSDPDKFHKRKWEAWEIRKLWDLAYPRIEEVLNRLKAVEGEGRS